MKKVLCEKERETGGEILISDDFNGLYLNLEYLRVNCKKSLHSNRKIAPFIIICDSACELFEQH